jgi:hypothetical protein
MTRALLLTILLIVGLMSSCAENEPRPVPREKMTEIMTDIYLAEVYSTLVSDSTGISVNKNKDSLALYYKSVLSHHGITLDEFSNSLRWYSDHPNELDSVYINVLNELSTMEGLANAGATQ